MFCCTHTLFFVGKTHIPTAINSCLPFLLLLKRFKSQFDSCYQWVSIIDIRWFLPTDTYDKTSLTILYTGMSTSKQKNIFFPLAKNNNNVWQNAYVKCHVIFKYQLSKKFWRKLVAVVWAKNLFQFHKITLNRAVLSLFITVYAFFASFFHPGQFHHSYSALQ